MDKNRLCAITDGIVAIAATIMVLELAIPDHVTISNLLGEWTIFISYVLSFSIIYMSWYAHQNLINNIDNYSGRLFLINGLWIFLLSLIPFTTALVGKDINNSLSMFIYVFVSYMWMISFQLLSFQALRDNPDNRDKIYISWGYVAKISIVNIVALIFAIIVPPFSFVVMVILIIYLAVNLFKDWNND